jgi:hypothetical protein
MTYTTFEVSIKSGDALKFIRVVACDIPAAHADIRAAYGDDVEIVCTGWM